MSLFPAYSDEPGPSYQTTKKDENYDAKTWLTNSSFIPFREAVPDIIETSPRENVTHIISDTESDISSDRERHKRSKKRKKEKRKKSRKELPVLPVIEFTGNEEYYVDKEPIKGYLAVQKLHKPACPIYYRRLRMLGKLPRTLDKPEKRYFSKKRTAHDNDGISSSLNFSPLLEDQFTDKNKEFNRILAQNPRNVEAWVDYVNHQDRIPMKSTRTQLAERKIEIIEKALIHNFGNEKLYKLYVEIIDSTYPSFEVSKFLDKLLEKDPTNYILWSAQIYATQGSMARCIVPDVLKLYEECMQKIYRKSQDDEVMLKLFMGCALFLRQSGLNEQFFALIKLALELNVSVDKFQVIQPNKMDQQTLIEYEEVILKSGLPMNEIWLRIEKLRQNYNYLPCPTSSNCSDPQRIVFNSDICFFIYPLANKENCFALIVIILRLLKIPFLSSSSLYNRFLFKAESLNEFDSIEDILAVCLHQTTSLFVDSLNFDETLYELIKQMITSPSFLSSNIGYEIYLKTIVDILLICSECLQHDERKRTIFVLLWLRFERILLIMEKLSGILSNDSVRRVKTKVKNILKRDENRNVLNFYTEYALIECESDNLHVAENIFVTSISKCSGSDIPNSDVCHAHVTYAEILIGQENYMKAMKVLTCLALDISLEEMSGPQKLLLLSEPRKLLSLKKLTERLNDLVFIEKNVQIMELEQYFLPDYFVSLLKAKIYYQILLRAKLEAMAYLDNLLRQFIEKNSRHMFLRESIYELYLKVMQWPIRNCLVSNLLIYETTSRALAEFPENSFILRTCAVLVSHPWYKIRSLLTSTNSPLGIIFLIAAARYRVLKYKCDDDTNIFFGISCDIYNEMVYKRRVANILQQAVDKNSILRKNSLIWRLYLRSLCDIQASFERSKNALFSALDECPWHKSLYIDGSVYVPQELSQIQDLIIEKQLRIYALPEELEILRNDTFEAAPSSAEVEME